MRRIQILTCLLLLGFSSTGQIIEDLSFGTDSTFEVLTWNIEWFPKNDQITIDYVTQIIEALDVDILAIQEVDEISAFEQLIDSLGSYEGYLESSWFAGLAYIYKPDVVQINNIYEIYTTSPYWSPFPRSPMVMDLNFMNERIIVINNHFKCCGDGFLNLNDSGDEETRRYYASNLLKEYIDNNFTNENVIVLGDLNDILSDNLENNVFQPIINDTANYLFADYEIAFSNNSDWSYPTWPSHIDHILITNELFDEFEDTNSVIQTIKIDEYLTNGWWEYENNVSDHRPVALKLLINSNLGVTDLSTRPLVINYPNPFSSETTFSFKIPVGKVDIQIFNIQGHLVFSEKIPSGQSKFVWNPEELPNGIYIARLLTNNNELGALKLVLRR